MTTIRVGWNCATCRARGTVDIRHGANLAEAEAFVGAAHAVVQPHCHGTPTLADSRTEPAVAGKELKR